MTGIFEVDVANPLFKEVETRGIKWLRKRYGYASVLDTRKLRKYYDALLYPNDSRLRKLDFKADQYFSHTNRVAWELALKFPDGTSKPGWGAKDLDFLFYIDPISFYGVLVDANKQRELAYNALDKLPDGWRRFSKLNPGRYSGEGLAIPLADLEQQEAVLWTGIVTSP